MEETEEEDISITNCINNLTKHYLELYMDEKRAIVLHVKFSEKKYKKLRCLAYRKLYMKLHSPYIFPTKKEISTEIAKETVSENAITELSKLMLKFKYNGNEEQANKLLVCMTELENQNNEIVNNVLKVLLYLAGSNQIDSTQKVTLNYEKWNKGSSTLSDMFQFDEKSRNIFNEDLQHFNSLNGFNQDVFKSDMNLLFEKPPNHESLVLDEYLGKQMTFDRYEKEMEMSLFGGLVNSMTSSINISLTIPELQPTNPTDVFKPRASIESRVSSTDEGFHELSSSSATPEPLDNITNNIHHGLSIWDDAKDKNMGKDVYHGKGKLKGADDSLLKNYLTECDKTAFDCMFDISVSSIEKMTGKIYKVIVMQENVIYQHSKNVLIGIPSNVYIFNIMTCSIHPITNIRCSGISDDSLYGFMNKFAKIGTNFRRLNKFCYHHTEKPFKGLSGGLVLKAFVDAVQKILYSFWAAVFAIEDDVSLTLLKLWQLFERYGRQLQFLSDICLCSAAYKRTSAKEQKPKFPVGANLLSYLYTLAIENSSTDNSVLLLFLFKAVSKIYIRFVRDWLFNGTCDDPYNEFFVQVDDQYLNYRDKHYWTQGFQMKETKNAIPLYLDSLADHIYSCGKALNLLKLIDIKHYMFDQVIKPPVIGITFSSTKLDSIESESKKYLETVHKCQENYIAMKEKEKLERQEIFREKLENERQSVKIVSERIEALEKNVREAIQEKKHEQFLDLKQQFEEAVKLRKEMKEKKLEDDKYWLAEIRKQEDKEDSIKQKAREDLISYYEKLSREAERRESKARWFISRHELTSKRIDFLNDSSERIKQMSADDEEAKKSWIEPMQYLPTYHNTQQNTLKSSNTEIPINNLDKDSQLIHSNLEGNAMKSLIYNASDNTSTIPQDQSQKPIEGSETKSLLYPGSIEHESQSHFPHNDTKQNDGTNMKNIIYDTKEQTTTERDNFQRITTNEEGKETKNLLYPSEIIISETSHVISEHSNEGNMTKSLLYPDETDGYPDQSAVVRKAFKVEGDETKNIIYSSIGKEISYQKKHDDKLGGDIAKAILYNEPAESVSKPLVKEFERPSVMQDVLYNQTNTNSEYVTKEFEKPSVMQEILYSDTKAINQHVTKEFEKPSVMQNILYSDENMTDVQREHVVRSFEQPSVMQDILYSEQSNVEKIERRNYRGFEPKVKIKDLMYPKDNIEVRKQVEIKELSKDEVWMDSMVEPFRDEYKIMDCDPQPNMFGDCQQFALPFVDDVKDIDADIIKKLPLETIIRRSLTVPILSQISLMNKALVDYFLVDLNIRDHFDAFRKFLLLEDGEFGHSLCNQLFSKVASGMKATDFCNTIALGNIISESVGISLYASSIEYSDQLKFATKWIPEVLQVSDIGVLDFLELRYRVPWPCNIVITENSINKYNKVFSFLLRLKKAGWSLQNVFTNLKRAANSRKSACSPQLRQLQLFSTNHAERLESLCRSCGNKIKKSSKYRYPVTVTSYKNEIEQLFNVDVTADQKDVHPPNICESCKQQFERYKNVEGLIAESSFFEFQPHSNTDCFVCCYRTTKLARFSLVKLDPEKKSNCWLTSYILNRKCKQFGLINTSDISADANHYTFSKIIVVNEIPTIQFSVKITAEGNWSLYGFNRELTKFSNFENPLQGDNLDSFLNYIQNLHICIANPDFPGILRKWESSECFGELTDKMGNSVAAIESTTLVTIDLLNTIRHVDCKYLVENELSRCIVCTTYRKTLNTISWRLKNQVVPNEPHKNTPNIYLSKEQLQEKASQLASDVIALRQSVNRYEEFLKKVVVQEGTSLNSELHEICSAAIQADCPFPENSPLRLLWDQQKKQCSLSNKKSMRWHPVMLRWCISIYLKSPGAYDHLRNSGFLHLPHKSTLLQYANFTEPTVGINSDVIKNLYEETKSHIGPQRIVGMLFDEMKVKNGVLYNRHSGKIVGFSDFGDMNNELERFRKRIEGNETCPSIASHILTFMVRGLCSSLNYPFAYYPGQGFTSDQLYPCFWECVRVLESIRLNVCFVTSDGAAPNRRFYRIHQMANGENMSVDGVVYWCWNLFALEQRRKIYFVCDVPHLIKTVRNNFENSHFHNNTRNLMVKERQISWQHIISLLDFDCASERKTFGLRQTKLSADHVFLTPALRMNVSLAAQVISNSVVLCLQKQNHEKTIETRNFIRYFDRFFDCLNVKSKGEGQKKKKQDLLPYTNATDERLKWLKDDFLLYINNWEEASNKVPNLKKDEKNKLCLSKQTLEGLRITVNSFVELVPDMLSRGASYVLSDKLNQDPLEEHFGRQRMKGGCNENPNVLEYQYNELKLQIAKSESIRVLRGNTRGRSNDSQLDINDMTPLPKRQKTSKRVEEDDL